MYSTTSPLQLQDINSDYDTDQEMIVTNDPNQHQIILGLQCNSAMFSGKKRREAPLVRSQSMGSYFLFTSDEEQVRVERRKKRYEERDSKGGFNIWLMFSTFSFSSQSINRCVNGLGYRCETGFFGFIKGD